jgi:hypothetical protein
MDQVPTPEVEIQQPASKNAYWLVAALAATILLGAGTLFYVSRAKQGANVTTTPTPVATATTTTVSISTASSELTDALTELDKDLASVTTDSATTDDDVPTL